MSQTPKSGKLFFYLVVAFATLLMFTLFRPYLSSIFLSIVFAISFQPLYRLFTNKFRLHRLVSTALVITTFITVILVPLIFFFVSLFGEINNLLIRFQIESLEQATIEVIDLVNSFYASYPLLAEYKISEEFLLTNIQSFLNSYYEIMFNSALNFGTSTLVFAIRLVVFSILLVVFIPNLKKLESQITHLSPLGEEVTTIYVKKIRGFISTFVLYWLPIALVQGVLGGFILLVLRVPNTLLYTSLMILLAIIPVIGPGLVLGPLSLYYILSGNLVVGLVILAWYLVVVSNIDNILRTAFVSKKIDINPMVLFISFLAGLQIFGLMGIFYGPLIVVLFFTTLEIYNRYYK